MNDYLWMDEWVITPIWMNVWLPLNGWMNDYPWKDEHMITHEWMNEWLITPE